MLPVKIDISNPIDRYSLSESQAADMAAMVTVGLANIYANNMIELAKKELNSTRKMFVNGIKVVQLSKYACAVDLIGVMPNAITFGMSPFDMKDGFSKSAKRVSKKGGGWYLTIPMRWANPNAIASSQVFSGTMPPEIYNLAKRLQSGITGKDTLRTGDLPAGFDDSKFRPAMQVADEVREQYDHKSPMFAGLQKSGSGKNTQYSTFRRVSDKSDPNSWMHSGIIAKNIHIKAYEMMSIGDEAKRIIDSYLDGI